MISSFHVLTSKKKKLAGDRHKDDATILQTSFVAPNGFQPGNWWHHWAGALDFAGLSCSKSDYAKRNLRSTGHNGAAFVGVEYARSGSCSDVAISWSKCQFEVAPKMALALLSQVPSDST